MKKPLPPLPWRIVLCFQNFGLWRKVRKIDAAVVSLEKLGQLDESLRLAAVSGKIWDRILGDKNNQARRARRRLFVLSGTWGGFRLAKSDRENNRIWRRHLKRMAGGTI